MGTPVDRPEAYDNQLARMSYAQDDGSFKAGFRVYDVVTTKNGKKKLDASWSFAKRDEEGEIVRDEQGRGEYWYVNWTMWDQDLMESVGSELAQLFAPGIGERNVWISILLDPESVWAEGSDAGRIYLKIDPNDDSRPEKKGGNPANRVWLHRPNWNNMSPEQQMLWEAKGKPDWLNMYTCEGGDPFASAQEAEPAGEEVREPVAVGAAGSRIEEEEYLDL